MSLGQHACIIGPILGNESRANLRKAVMRELMRLWLVSKSCTLVLQGTSVPFGPFEFFSSILG